MRWLQMEWKNSGTKKDFKTNFSAQRRKFMCGYPAFKAGGIDIRNEPTLHQKIHDFDYFKKIGYQMNSRLFTDNGESVAEIQAKRGKDVKLEKME